MIRQDVLKVLENHGFGPDTQTEALNGQLVEKGSSFDEMLGIKENYRALDVYQWLGY